MTADELPIDDTRRAGAARDWRTFSVCRSHPTQWWFAGGNREIAQAKEICSGCSVQVECLEFALARPDLTGIWAGTTPSERGMLRRARLATEPVSESVPELVALVPPPAAEPAFVSESDSTGSDSTGPDSTGLDSTSACAPPDAAAGADRGALLTPAEAARRLGVTPNTVTRWSRAGRLAAIQTIGGHRRFRRAEIERVLRAGAATAPVTPA